MYTNTAAGNDAKAAFRRQFRLEKIGLVYSPAPAAEGRLIPETNGLQAIRDYDLLVDSATRSMKPAVTASFLLALLFGVLLVALRMPILAPAVPASLLIWLVSLCGHKFRQWRFRRNLWAAVARRPTVAALQRHEAIRRGYRMDWRHWLWILPAGALMMFLEARVELLPASWRVAHEAFVLAVALATGGALIVVVALKLAGRLKD
jgi:hypothetical protein